MIRRAALLAGAVVTIGSSTARADVDLIAWGSIGGNQGDRAWATAGALENGVAGNVFGGIGSGLAHAGGDVFLALPDRGPNAVAWNGAVDDTTSYIPRFHTLRLALRRADRHAALPFALDVDLRDTTLLWTRQPLAYGPASAALGVDDGTPSLNHGDVHYFTGRSDGFVAGRPSTWPSDARLDPESIRVSPDRRRIYISDEYGPYIYELERETGRRVRVFGVPSNALLPDDFAAHLLSAHGDDEVSPANNPTGRVANKGMEGLALSPDGRTLFGCMQSPLNQDGGTGAAYTRILRIDIESGETTELAYPLDSIGTPKKPKYPTISDCVAVNGHQLLMDERDGKGLGDGSEAAFKKVYLVDLDGAEDVSAVSGEANLAARALDKVLLLDVVQVLGQHGIDAAHVPAKLEGLAFGEDVRLDGRRLHTLYVANDNDFLGTFDGEDNPNQFFVFGIDEADLPGFEAERFDHPGDGEDWRRE